MAAKHHVFLIPGFFGFANLGGLLYFAHVVEHLQKLLGHFGLECEIHRVPTHPTASIRTRAATLLETVASVADGDCAIHLIGHSTGGLDARLLVTPGASLPTALDVAPIADRVRSVITISTPHHGTPLSGFFAGAFGRQILRVFSLATIHTLRFGHLPLSAMLKLAAVVVQLDGRLGLTNNVADQVFSQLLGDFSEERRREVQQFLERASLDQALLTQLTHEGADVFNAGTADREGVRYGSVISMAPRPGLRSTLRIGLDPYAHMTHGLFHLLYRASALSTYRDAPELSDDQSFRVQGWLGVLPAPYDNDGVVPTLSQVWGEVICATVADHLDVIGHFDDAQHQPPHYDWLASGSSFNRRRFEQIWTDVARFITARSTTPARRSVT